MSYDYKRFIMNCKEFKSISLLFIDNELTEEIKSSANNHLSACESCSSYVQYINSIYSEADTLLKDKRTDMYFYTRLKARMESELSFSNKGYRQISFYLQPAFYTLIVFTLLLSLIIITGNVKNKQQNNTSTLAQSNNSEDSNYLKTTAMNEQTFEEDYLKIINK